MSPSVIPLHKFPFLDSWIPVQTRSLRKHSVQSDPGKHLQGEGGSTQREELGSAERGLGGGGQGGFRKAVREDGCYDSTLPSSARQEAWETGEEG